MLIGEHFPHSHFAELPQIKYVKYTQRNHELYINPKLDLKKRHK